MRTPTSAVPLIDFSDPYGVLEHAPLGFAVLGRDLTMRYLNVAGADLVGIERERLVGRALLDVFPQAATSPIVQRLQQAIATGASMQFEEHLQLQSRWLAITVYPIPDGLVAYFTDNTDRHIAAAQLQTSAGRLQRVIDVAQSGVWDLDLRTGSAMFSERFEQIFGVERGEHPHAASTFEQFILPEDLPALVEASAAGMREGRPYLHECRARRRDGTLIWVRIRGEIECDALGTPVRALGVLTDVSERVAAAEALQESQRQLAIAQRLAGIGSWSWDLATNAVSWSDEMFRIQGYDPATSVASFDKVLAAAVSDERRAEFMTRVQQALAGEAEYDFVLPMQRPDGSVRVIHTRGEVERAPDGTPLRMTGTVEDVTDAEEAAAERERLERQVQHAQKLESLGVLAGGIAHDFNNLLVGVLTNASLALMDLAPNTPVYEAVHDIEQAAQRAAELTRQLLAYSGKGRFIVEPVSLSELASEMAHLLRTVVSKDAKLRLDLAPALPTVRGDATQLRQILMNLITNASDSLTDGFGTIALRTRVTDAVDDIPADAFVGEPAAPGRWIRLEVSDAGVGMDPDTLHRIFDPFFTTKFTGRGLGLAATLGIVRGHQGAIAVTSAPGRGTTFTLLFPPSSDPSRRVTPVSTPIMAEGEGTVLVVDDDGGVRRVAETLLQRHGYHVVCATNGREAVECLRLYPGRFRAVLLDLTMPVMGGSEALRHLRELEPALPVILMSGYSDAHVEQTFADSDLAGFLQKPFRAQELYAALSIALATK